MRSISGIYLILIIMLAIIIGCSSAGDTVTAPVEIPAERMTSSSHQLWGLYRFTADKINRTLDVVPIREADLHLNALSFLEPPPNTNLTIESLNFNGSQIDVEIGLRHPFLGLTEFTGFDVRGILIGNGSIGGFTDPAILLPGEDDLRLVNPDGYSRWWNPAEFPVNPGTIFGYQDGLLGTPDSAADFSATVNGYKYFCNSLENSDDPLTTLDPEQRGMFSAGNKNVRMYRIDMGTGGLVFNYAIDASWQFPSGGPPWEAPDDFGPGANAPEPWCISVSVVENSLWNDGVDSGGHLSLVVEAYDWYGAALNTLSIESPGNFTPLIDEPPLGISEYAGLWEFDTGSASPGPGSIDILFSAKCESSGYGGILPGISEASYRLLNVPVGEEPVEPQEFKGWAGFGYNTENTSYNPYTQDFDYTDYSEKWYTEDLGYTRTGISISEDYAYASSCMSAFTDEEHHLSCYDLTDGTVKWTKYLNPTFPGGATFYSYTSPFYFVEYNVGKVVIGGDRVWCFNAVTGNIEWEYGLVGWNFCENSPKYYGGKVYITGEPDPWVNQATLHCIDASDGTHIWSTPPTPGSTYSVPAIKDGKVYWGMYGKVYCFDAVTGTQLWVVNHGLSAFDCMTIIGDRLYFVQFNEQLVCMNTANGDVIWEWDEPFHTGSVPHAFSPVLTHWYAGDGSLVLCFRAEAKGGLHAIKDLGNSAEMIWCWGQNNVSVYGSPVYNDGIVYFGEGSSDYLLGLDVRSGAEVFHALIDNGPYGHGSYGQAGFAYGKLVVSCIDGVYCFE